MIERMSTSHSPHLPPLSRTITRGCPKHSLSFPVYVADSVTNFVKSVPHSFQSIHTSHHQRSDFIIHPKTERVLLHLNCDQFRQVYFVKSLLHDALSKVTWTHSRKDSPPKEALRNRGNPNCNETMQQLEFSTVPFAPILFCSKRGNSDMSGFVRSSCGIWLIYWTNTHCS